MQRKEVILLILINEFKKPVSKVFGDRFTSFLEETAPIKQSFAHALLIDFKTKPSYS